MIKASLTKKTTTKRIILDINLPLTKRILIITAEAISRLIINRSAFLHFHKIDLRILKSNESKSLSCRLIFLVCKTRVV